MPGDVGGTRALNVHPVSGSQGTIVCPKGIWPNLETFSHYLKKFFSHFNFFGCAIQRACRTLVP